MISGIYKLTFDSNRIYIGKSENIEARWRQHQSSFLKRTHSKKMQAEYNQYGAPTYEIILYVHQDHIDIFESIIIHKFWGPNCLNTTKPKPISQQDAEKYLGYYDDLTHQDHSIMLYSTLVHIQLIEEYHNKLANATQELKLSQCDVEELELRGIKTPEGWGLINKQLVSKNKQLTKQTNTQHQELTRLKNLGWWDRLFTYKVYV